DILSDGIGEKKGSLWNDSDLAVKRLKRKLFDRNVVDQYLTFIGIVHSRNQLKQRCLSFARCPYKRNRLTGFYKETEILQDRVALRISEGDVSEFNFARYRIVGRNNRLFWIVDVRALLDNLFQSRHGSSSALSDIHHPPERDGRPNQHREIRIERHKFAQGQATQDDRTAPKPQHDQDSKTSQHFYRRIKHTPETYQLAIALQILQILAAELSDFLRFAPKRLDHLDAAQVFLNRGADSGELRLDFLKPRMDDLAVACHHV